MFLVLFTLGMINSARAQYMNPLTCASMIALQVVRTSFGFHLKRMYGKLLTPPDPSVLKILVLLSQNKNKAKEKKMKDKTITVAVYHSFSESESSLALKSGFIP